MRHAGGSITYNLTTMATRSYHRRRNLPTAIAILLDDAYDEQDSATFLDMTFPLETNGVESLDCARFPAGYHIDVDADGVQDLSLVLTPTLKLMTMLAFTSLKTTARTMLLNGRLYKQIFFKRHDNLGRGAYPVLTDIDGDSIIDLIVSNKERYEDIGVTPCDVSFYKNTGHLLLRIHIY